MKEDDAKWMALSDRLEQRALLLRAEAEDAATPALASNGLLTVALALAIVSREIVETIKP